MSDGRPLLIVDTGEHRAHCVAFSADGRRLAVGLSNGLVLVRRLDTGRPERQLLHDLLGRPVHAVAFCAGAPLLATAGADGQMKLCDLRTGKVLLKRQHPGAVRAVGLDAAGGRVATACADGVVRVWSRGGRLLSQRAAAGTATPRGLRFGPDGVATVVDTAEPAPFTVEITDSQVRLRPS